ncbi:PH domain-containing protein [Citricoccus nitrophenolicus]|uniref:PH domain-containing protein n=1 Tax=Citricoccus nitrophenolicus TaxID=863575 RepID=A0ABV0IF62_9MICC
MATISRTVSWTLLTNTDDALARVQQAVAQTDFQIARLDRAGIDIDVPRAIIKNRWGAKVHGDVTESAEGVEILWTVEGLGDKHYEHLATIAERLPDGILFDHGIPAAATTLSNRFFGRREIRHLANLLDRRELVHALGVGQFANKMGIAALTDRRLFFLEKSMLGSEDMTEFSLGSIGALSIGKKGWLVKK